jgi:methyl-accepting chemotaxis protein
MAKSPPNKTDILSDSRAQNKNNNNILSSGNNNQMEDIWKKREEQPQYGTKLEEKHNSTVKTETQSLQLVKTSKVGKFKTLRSRLLTPNSQFFEISKQIYSQQAFEQSEFLRRTVLLRLFSLILLGCFGAGPGVTLLSIIKVGKLESPLVGEILFDIGAILCFILSYLWAGRGAYKYATWTMVFGFWLSYGYSCWLYGPSIPIALGFVVLLSFAVILMSGLEISILTVLSLLYGIGIYIGEHILKFYEPPLALPIESISVVNVGFAAFAVPAIVAIQYFPNKSHVQTLQEQNERLQQTLAALEARQNNSQSVSQEVLSLAEGLNATSEQQASGSLRQVGAITQVSAAMTELGTAATHIAELAEQVSQAAEAMGGRTEEIEASTRQAASQTELGLAAAESTVTTSEEVAELYEGLLGTTEDLTMKTAEMQRIMTLTGTIATEIHLLSLNASIEAAGAGQHGDRFRVVAQAVKDLAQRSFTASTEVIGVVSQVETAVQLANASTQQGFEKARKMAQIARRTGDVITGLQRVADRSQSQAVLIASMLDEVQGQINTIRTATFQQKNASQQVQGALQELSDLARDVAQGSKAISNNSVELRETAEHLKITLFEEEIISH